MGRLKTLFNFVFCHLFSSFMCLDCSRITRSNICFVQDMDPINSCTWRGSRAVFQFWSMFSSFQKRFYLILITVNPIYTFLNLIEWMTESLFKCLSQFFNQIFGSEKWLLIMKNFFSLIAKSEPLKWQLI